jgi:predicted anti-sigma-YlaC factor YlaD
MNYIVNRATEPSTWAGIAAISGTLAASTTGWMSYALGAVAAVAASLATFMKDHGAPDVPK